MDSFAGARAERIKLARKAARSGTLNCPFEGECEPTVAMISVVTDEGLERCSGVLIGEDRVLTNDHCINKSISLQGWNTRNRQLPCVNAVFVHLAGNKTLSSVTAGCRAVEFRSGESGVKSQDYAILKLDQKIQDRAPLKLSNRGFNDHEKARIIRVQMEGSTPGTFNGNQSVLECRASHSTFLYPLLNSSGTPLMTFGDCAIQSGNSGSPIINQDGEMGGIVQGYLTPKADAGLEIELREHLLDETYGLVGVGSQVGCMEELNPESSRTCTLIPPLTNEYPKDFLNQVTPSFDELSLPGLDGDLRWGSVITESQYRKRFVTHPACVKDQQKFRSQQLEYKKGLNSFMQAEWRVQNVFGDKILEFLLQGSFSGAQVTYQSSSDASRLDVPVCH